MHNLDAVGESMHHRYIVSTIVEATTMTIISDFKTVSLRLVSTPVSNELRRDVIEENRASSLQNQVSYFHEGDVYHLKRTILRVPTHQVWTPQPPYLHLLIVKPQWRGALPPWEPPPLCLLCYDVGCHNYCIQRHS